MAALLYLPACESKKFSAYVGKTLIQSAAVFIFVVQSFIRDGICLKSKAEQTIPLPRHLLDELSPEEETGFLLNSYTDLSRETPLSYTEAVKSFKRIQKQCGVEGYTAHDFRDTCATEWRESRISIGLIARLLGHKKTDVTEQRYVKYRPELFSQIKDKMDVYGINNGTDIQR